MRENEKTDDVSTTLSRLGSSDYENCVKDMNHKIY